ncbi:MAG: acyl--CoA ligase [Deltaproteobacteria bacterium]|nr:acyl--CoA ligase [Deltaproteobacteria bacterium]MBN2846092.1 acyl--CoA ligase [Deltaproteobacteria bacterium]
METKFIRLPLLNSYIEHWAKVSPDRPAMIQHEDGKTVTYRNFLNLIDYFALRLLDMGIGKGDRVATMLVLIPEHIILMYACFKIGAIIAPLDVRLKDDEVVRDLHKIEPKAFFFLGNTPVRDFREVGKAVREQCLSVKHLIQMTPNPEPGDIIDGAVSITRMMSKNRIVYLKIKNLFTRKLQAAWREIVPRSPALIIYTTGTTGDPKPALICHENIIVQNEILARGADMDLDARILINLPPSHVGCVTEGFMTTMAVGGTAILLRIFDVKMTLEAIESHMVNAFGQIPTQYRMLWAHPDYEKYDLSSLKFVIYAGSAVDVAFLRKLSKMAPAFGTGIGMTENAGFATFTPSGISVEEMAGQVGRAFSDLAEVTIRRPMNEDGTAGDELSDGKIGEICYHSPIVFLGYYNMPEETAKAISREGILYTGDLGYFKDMGTYRALYLAGRRKFVIKQKGYNVFPDEVESHIAGMDGVDVAEVVGMKHNVFDEGIFAFVRPKKDVDCTPEMVMKHCEKIASYKRPQHVEIWPPEREFPLTRSTKVDKLELQKIAEPIVEKLREESKWD